jgi:hypothetical protein
MQIDGENGEMPRYNNSASIFNAYMNEYRKHYNKTHMPLSVNERVPEVKQSTTETPDEFYVEATLE